MGSELASRLAPINLHNTEVAAGFLLGSCLSCIASLRVALLFSNNILNNNHNHSIVSTIILFSWLKKIILF